MVRAVRRFGLCLLPALLLLSGCAESIYLTSRPRGALVTINGRPVGRTPLTYSVLPANWDPPYRVRVEQPGYAPVEGVLPTGVSEGRVVGGIATLGLSLFFKQPETFLADEQIFLLRPLGTKGAAGGTDRGPRPEPRPPLPPYDPPGSPAQRREPPPSYEYERPYERPSRPPPPEPPRPPPPPPPRPTASPKPAPSLRPTAPPPAPTVALEPAVPAPVPDAPPGVSPEIQAELERLRQLRDDGVIVDAEYEQLRESVLKGQ